MNFLAGACGKRLVHPRSQVGLLRLNISRANLAREPHLAPLLNKATVRECGLIRHRGEVRLAKFAGIACDDIIPTGFAQGLAQVEIRRSRTCKYWCRTLA